MELKKYKFADLLTNEPQGVYGIPAPAEDFDPCKKRYLRITDISDDGILLDTDKKSVSAPNIEQYLLQKNDIVFARTGNSTGRAYLYNENDGELAFAGFLIKYSVDPQKVNPLFLRYFTISNYYKQWVQNLSVGSTRGNISAKTFLDFPIILPNRKQQDFLAKILNDIDTKIAINKKLTKELESMAKELYDYWFVQFDFPGIDGKPYKSSGGKMIYNTILKREIPEGWEVKKLEDLAKIQKHQITPKAGIEYKHYSLPSFDECESYSIENGNTIFSDKFLVESGNLLISKLNPWTDRTVWVDDVSNAICSTEYVVLKQNDKCIQSYLNQIAHTQSFIDYCTSCSTGTSHSHRRVKPELMTGYKVPFQENIVKAFGNQIYPIIQKKLIIQNENRELTILRDELLPMLMNGQVSVKE